MSGNESCHSFDDKQVTIAVASRVTMSSLAFLACAVVVVVITAFKGYRRFMYRLMTYFMVVDLLTSLAELFEAASVSYSSIMGAPSVREGWSNTCVAFAFMDQVLTWMSNCVIVWIILYLMSLVYDLYHFDNRASNDDVRFNKTRWCKEAIGLLLVIIVPFTFNWVPFLWNMYGLSGLFCWIKEVSNPDDCSSRHLSAILMFSMSYGPLLFLIFCCFLCFMLLTILLCVGSHSPRTSDEAKERFKVARKEIAFVLAFPLLYYSLFSVAVVDRLYSMRHSNRAPFYPLWIAHVIATPSRLLISPIAFLCHPYVWKTLLCHRKRRRADSLTYHIVPPEMDDINTPLVIRGCPQYSGKQIKGLLPPCQNH